MSVLERLSRAGVVPVAVIDRADDAVPAARAIFQGGIDVMEITFRTPAAAEAIRRAARECPEMLIGAGTVTSPAQCREALELGARFIVSAGLDEETVRWCVAHKAPVLPGCVTPTELLRAVRLGLDTVKFFPAGIYGGLPAMRALAAPFPGVRFLPTGGVGAEALAEYLSEPFIFAVGGSWLCAREDIAAQRFDKIAALCREASRIVSETRANK